MADFVNIDNIKLLQNVRTESTDVAELMDSIKQHGLLEPIGVWKIKSNEYVLAFGNRRLEAVKKLGYTKLKIGDEIKILSGRPTKDNIVSKNVIENVQRQQISTVELGRICDILWKLRYSPKEIASKLSLPSSRIQSALDIYRKLPEEFRSYVGQFGKSEKEAGKLPPDTIQRILMARNLKKDEVKEFLDVAKREELSTEKVNIMLGLINSGSSIKDAQKKTDEYVVIRIDFPFNKLLFNELMEKYKFTTKHECLFNLLMGKIPAPKGLIYNE